MVFESRERARRNPAQYPKITNQQVTGKRSAPSVPNRSKPVKNYGKAMHRRNRQTYRGKKSSKARLVVLIFAAIFLLRLGHMLYTLLHG